MGPGSRQFTDAEKTHIRQREEWQLNEGGYNHIQGTKPQTLSYGLNDSPVGLAAWIVEKYRAWSDCNGDVETRFSKDELLTNIVSYGYEDTDEHWIDVHFGVDDGVLKVEIVDDSKPYNILERDDPDISLSMEDKPIGGLGVFLIKKLMSSVDYYTKEGKNHLVMTKELE